jgi:hypothetical protein
MIDMSDVQKVYTFVEDFRNFLHEEGREYEAQMFMSLVANYYDKTPKEDLRFPHLLTIASQFADIEDVSGHDLAQNPFMKDDDGKSVEEILEGIETREHHDDIPDFGEVPACPECVLVVDGPTTPEKLVMRTLGNLCGHGYGDTAEMFRSELAELLEKDPPLLDIIHLIRSYVNVTVRKG